MPELMNFQGHDFESTAARMDKRCLLCHFHASEAEDYSARVPQCPGQPMEWRWIAARSKYESKPKAEYHGIEVVAGQDVVILWPLALKGRRGVVQEISADGWYTVRIGGDDQSLRSRRFRIGDFALPLGADYHRRERFHRNLSVAKAFFADMRITEDERFAILTELYRDHAFRLIGMAPGRGPAMQMTGGAPGRGPAMQVTGGASNEKLLYLCRRAIVHCENTLHGDSSKGCDVEVAETEALLNELRKAVGP